MLDWLKSLFRAPKPSGPPETLRVFGPADTPLTRDGVAPYDGGWQIEALEGRTVRLFEVPDPGAEQCLVTYRATMKCEGLEGRAFLEMWCRIPGRGEFFSKGLNQALSGSVDWASYEIPFYLKKGQRPDLVKLNVVVEGRGQVAIRDVELLTTLLG
jgi:hypothetical protein